MPGYHADAKTEVQAILSTAGRGTKRCLGMMVKRHLLMDGGTASLTHAEMLYAGSGTSVLYEVVYLYSAWSRVACVYEVTESATSLLAIDAWQGMVRVGIPSTAPDARARAWGRSS